jgi:hypothetical protein
MKNFDIENLLTKKQLDNELDLERAMIADRKLRILSREDAHFKDLRKKLRDLIEEYENRKWSNADQVSEEQIAESDVAEFIAEQERLFMDRRTKIIKGKLKELKLTQEQLALLLGHKSKTHMSELINGIRPFKLTDIVVIHRLLKIDMQNLIPIFLSNDEKDRINDAAKKIQNPNIKLSKEDLMECAGEI